MALLNYLTIVVFLLVLCYSTTTFAQENSTSQQRNKTIFIGCNIKPINETTNLTTCKLDISDSEINEVLSKHENITTTNIVRITVSIVRGNKTKCCQKMEFAWASEVGRTLLTLVQRAKDTIFTSLLFTTTLEVGTQEVNIQVKEKTDGCLPPGEPGSELIFDYLLRRLSHNDDTHFFKLCKRHNDDTSQFSTFNCCRIVGDRNLAICADYSSTVVRWTLPVIITIFCISGFMVVPFMLQYVITYPESKFYKMSDSPMSLPSIATVILFEGRGPVKSFFRRYLFVGLSYLVAFYPDFFGFLWLLVLFCVWVLFFLIFYDIQMTYEACKQECIKKRKKVHKCEEKCIKCIEECEKDCTMAMKLDCSLISPSFEEGKDAKGVYNNCVSKVSKSLNSFFEYLGCVCSILFLFVAPLFLMSYVFVVLFRLLIFTLKILQFFYIFIFSHHKYFSNWQKFFLPFLRPPTLVMIIFLTGMIFIFVLSLVASLTLNAEFFSPFIAPIFGLLAYVWKNWKWSVEAKCLRLKTLIINVSQEKSQTSNIDIVEETNIIKFDEKGEAMIPKELYKTIQKEVLNLDHILFHFFRRMIFVVLYSFCLLAIMILARDSAVSGIVQIISGILGVLIPFVFDSIFAEPHLSQRNSEEAAMKQKLEHLLKTTKLHNNTILVEMANIDDTGNPTKSLKTLHQQITLDALSFIALCEQLKVIEPTPNAFQPLKPALVDLLGLTPTAEAFDKLYQQITPTAESLLALFQQITPLVDSIVASFQNRGMAERSLENVLDFQSGNPEADSSVTVDNSILPTRKQMTTIVNALVAISERILSTAGSLVEYSKYITSAPEKLILSHPATKLLNKFFPQTTPSTDSDFEKHVHFIETIQSLVSKSHKTTPIAESLVTISRRINDTLRPILHETNNS